MADQLATPEDLASLLERDDLDTDKAILLIECATALVQTITLQRIVQVVDDVLVLPLDQLDRGRYIELPERPVTAVSAVLINAMPITDFTLSRGRLWRPYGWELPRYGAYVNMPRTVTVTYTHGYAPGDQRLQLARSAVLTLCKEVFGNPTAATGVEVGDVKVRYQRVMTAQMDATPVLCAALRRRYSRPPRSAVLTR